MLDMLTRAMETAKPQMVVVLRATSWLLTAIAVGFFFFGRIFHELLWLPGELGGILVGVIFAIIGYLAKVAADRVLKQNSDSD